MTEKSDLRSFTDIRDGKIYKTVKIGDQIWMAENLAYMPSIYSGKKEGGIWVYDYYGKKGFLGYKVDIEEAKATENFKNYGCLYNWETACTVGPRGWHLPSHEEWAVLEMHLGMSESDAESYGGFRAFNEGLKLKSSYGWKSAGNGNNESGFNALPGGYFGNSGGVFGNLAFRDKGECAYFWTSSDTFVQDALKRILKNTNENICADLSMKESGFSVRCIKD